MIKDGGRDHRKYDKHYCKTSQPELNNERTRRTTSSKRDEDAEMDERSEKEG